MVGEDVAVQHLPSGELRPYGNVVSLVNERVQKHLARTQR